MSLFLLFLTYANCTDVNFLILLCDCLSKGLDVENRGCDDRYWLFLRYVDIIVSF